MSGTKNKDYKIDYYKSRELKIDEKVRKELQNKYKEKFKKAKSI